MLSRNRKIAAAALLLLLAQDEDFGSSVQEVEDPPPRRRIRHHAPSSRVAREREPVEFIYEDLDSTAAEVGEPIDEYLPSPVQTSKTANPGSRPQTQDVALTQRKRLRTEDNAAIRSDIPPTQGTTSSQRNRSGDEAPEDNLSNPVSVEEEPVPFYVPPPSKFRKKKKSSRRQMDLMEEAAGSTSSGGARSKDKKQKRFWTQRMYLQRDHPPDHPLSAGIPYMDPTEELKVLRMSEECFETLLNLVSPLIEKKSTLMREAISPRQRLVAVLRFLVTGQSLEDLKFSTLLSPSVMNTVVPETCQAIIQVLSPEYMKFPEKSADWQEIASGFSESCDFPNCGGSLNARHVSVFKGKGTPHHVNHQGYTSVILATLVDANHKFISAEVITDERESDESAIWQTDFFGKLCQDALDLPETPENEGQLDFVFVAPNSFPVHERILMTYPVKHLDNHNKISYNDKIRTLSRYSDNALGLMVSRFGIFRIAINQGPWKVDLMARACCAIHNFLSVEGKHEYIDDNTYDCRDQHGNIILGEWRRDSDSFCSPLKTILREPSPENDQTRAQYVEYFCAKLLERNLSLLL